MVRHQQVAELRDWRLFASFFEHTLERLEVCRLLKQLHAPDAAIQHVEYHSTRRDACCSGHADAG